ncbi:MAG: hypothetical protein IKE94_07625 [Aeriscardovia sp.]|nr:hypothetical protein [Aeriscardovia sp.]
MIKQELEQFLDTGWYNEATLYYKGKIYWCEGYTQDNQFTFFVNCWEVDIIDDQYYKSKKDSDGQLLNFKEIYKVTNADMDYVKKEFLEAKIFEDKSFWEIEPELKWLEE